jgi:hypothetical protein
MLELVGTVTCDISVIDMETDDNKKLTTTSFTLYVEKAAFGGEDITSDPQFDVLVALMDAATVAQEALDKSNEANAKYDACVEATANANAVRAEIEAGGYIESLKEIHNGSKFRVWVGTQEEYDALEEKPNNTFCIITDDATTAYIQAKFKEIDESLSSTTEIAYSAFYTEIPTLQVSIGELDARKADAGYGYGEELRTYEAETQTLAEGLLDDILSGMPAETTKQFLFIDKSLGVTTAWHATIYKRAGDVTAVVEAVNSVYDGTKIRKAKYNSVWTPWEWENPPMYVGANAKRTTERYNGKAVYTKLVKIGLSGSKKSEQLTFNAVSAVNLVRFDASIVNTGGSYVLPCRLWSATEYEAVQVESYAENNGVTVNIEYKCGASVPTYGTLYVQLWYTLD